MTTITLKIQVPDELAARWEALPEEEREQFAVEALRDAFALADEETEDEEADEEPTSYPLTPEDIASLGRGFADAGRGVDGATFFKNLDAHIARLKEASGRGKAA